MQATHNALTSSQASHPSSHLSSWGGQQGHQRSSTRLLTTMNAPPWGVLAPVWLFTALLAFNLLRWLMLRRKSGFLTQHKVRLAREITDLRRQAEAFNNPAHYVKCAKYQRLANAKERELAALQESKGFGLQDKIDSAVSLLKFSFMAVVILACWGKALVHIPPHLTWPLGRLLAFPHASTHLGSVTVIPWVALCDSVSSLVARVLFPQPALDLRTQPLETVYEHAKES